MYNLIEYSSNYSQTTSSFWFYSKDEATNFNNNIENTDNFKYTEAVGANGILKNAIIAVLLKHLSNSWRSLKMPLINWKLELKLKWTNYCVLSAAGIDNVSNRDNKNIFTIKETKLYVSVVTLSTRYNQKLSKLLRKEFERSVHWNEYKTKKVRIKIQQMNTDFFSNQILLES